MMIHDETTTPIILHEGCRYSYSDLHKKLQLGHADPSIGERRLEHLRKIGVLKKKKSRRPQDNFLDYSEDDNDVVGDNVRTKVGEYYVIAYVGIIVMQQQVVYCCPKYMPVFATATNNSAESTTQLATYRTSCYDEMRLIMKVLEHYNKSTLNDDTSPTSASEQTSENFLNVLLFLLQDYAESGVYANPDKIREINGEGEIIWERTINNFLPIIHDGKPHYIDVITRRTVNNDADYFARLHRTILTRASENLHNLGLLHIFELEELHLSEDPLDTFGDDNYIIARLERELDVEFNTRKQEVLKAMCRYVEQKDAIANDTTMLHGTNSFHVVWEQICAHVFNNYYDKQIGELPLPPKRETQVTDNFTVSDAQRVKDIIEYPEWTLSGKQASDTLIPDIVTWYKKTDNCEQLAYDTPNENRSSIGHWDHNSGAVGSDNNSTQKTTWEFVIFDAKYYAPILEEGKKPQRVPGIESVTKQYLYHLAYKNFIAQYDFESVKNCFLMPTAGEEVIDKGSVKLSMFEQLGVGDFHFEHILVRYIPTNIVFHLYLQGKQMDIQQLRLDE